MARLATTLLLLAAIPAVAQAETKNPTKQQAPAELASAPELAQDKANKESWTYRKDGLDVSGYKSILIDPTAVYTGADAQFGKISSADQQKYAGIVTKAMTTELGKALPVVGQPGPGVLRLKFTLIGMTTTQGGLATVTRVLPVGLVLNTVKSAADKKGSFTGSLLYAVELSDADTGELLIAAVRRTAPDAMDIGSTLSTQDTVESISDHLAKSYRDRLGSAVKGAPAK